MALPTLSKTWQFNVNQTLSGASNLVWLAIKASLKGFATLPWTVWGSSDKTDVGNGDGVDRCLTEASIVHAAGDHSWFVLENPVTGVQVCFDFNSTDHHYATVVVSFAGSFGAPGSGGTGADGTKSARPTAADEVVIANTAVMFMSAGLTSKLHAMHSTDGTCSRIVLCYANTVRFSLCLERAYAPVSWTGDVCLYGFSTAALTYARFNDVSTACTSRCGGVTTAMHLSSEGLINGMLGENLTYPDDVTAEWPMSPMGVVSIAGSYRGRKGSLYDTWWGSTGVATGSTYPNDASRQFVQLDHFILPWNGTTPEIA